MSNKKKRIVILTENELRKTLSRLTSEIIEKVQNLDNPVSYTHLTLPTSHLV